MDWASIIVGMLIGHLILMTSALLIATQLKGDRLVSWRHRFGGTFVILLLLLFPHLALLHFSANQVSAHLGFSSFKTLRDASEAGVFNPTEWEEKKAVVALEEEERARRHELQNQRMAVSRMAALEQRAEECRADPKCFSEKVWSAAQAACSQLVESRAVYGFRWETNFFEDKFSHVSWLDQSDGRVAISGTKARLENQYGAWGKAEYTCSYNVHSNEAYSASVQIVDSGS
ncbi:MAG TPA: hypothetical protein VIL30_02035 [Ramlibacter sp.]|jgi:hypothetical protein